MIKSRNCFLSYVVCSWHVCNRQVSNLHVAGLISATLAWKVLIFNVADEVERATCHSCGHRGVKRHYRFHRALGDQSISMWTKDALPISIVWSVREKLLNVSANGFERLSPTDQQEQLLEMCDSGRWFCIALNQKQDRFIVYNADRTEEYLDVVDNLSGMMGDCTMDLLSDGASGSGAFSRGPSNLLTYVLHFASPSHEDEVGVSERDLRMCFL